jgi:hypothetical protein
LGEVALPLPFKYLILKKNSQAYNEIGRYGPFKGTK